MNARISDRSFPRYRRFRRLFAPVLSEVDLFLAQTQEDCKRLLEMGAAGGRAHVSGNLKFDIRPSANSPLVSDLRTAIAKDSPVIVCGSTAEGEEELLLAAFQQLLEKHSKSVMVLAPRHPERFDHVAGLVGARNLPLVRRSNWSARDALAGSVFLLDSVGELASIYAVADVAFVGGSLVPVGGHNILEPAQHGVAVMTGPHTNNFRERGQRTHSRDPGHARSRTAPVARRPRPARVAGKASQRIIPPAHWGYSAHSGSASSLSAERDGGAMNPLSAMFGAGVAVRNRLYDRKFFAIRKLSRPVVSVGNISVGGSGKTPFVIALGGLLKESGILFDVLSRGYGRSSREVLVVDPDGEPERFGDEPLLIARKLQVPVIVGTDRYEAGRLAEEKFPSKLHLLDDGFQHRKLHRDFDIVLLQAEDLSAPLLPRCVALMRWSFRRTRLSPRK